jgi:hypothetical protein
VRGIGWTPVGTRMRIIRQSVTVGNGVSGSGRSLFPWKFLPARLGLGNLVKCLSDFNERHILTVAYYASSTAFIQHSRMTAGIIQLRMDDGFIATAVGRASCVLARPIVAFSRCCRSFLCSLESPEPLLAGACVAVAHRIFHLRPGQGMNRGRKQK